MAEIERMGDDEENKNIIIDSLVYLKAKIGEYLTKSQIIMKTGSVDLEQNDETFG